MPEQPTRAQFEAAAKKVMETAPEGLSKDQFYALVDEEIGRQSYKPQSVLQMGRESLGVTSDAAKPKPNPINDFLNRLGLRAFQSAAYPEHPGDLLTLLPITGPLPTTAVAKGARTLGPAVAAIGSGLEAAGQATRRYSPFGLLGTMLSSDPTMQKAGLAEAAAPYIAEGAGKATQAVGRFMQRDAPVLSFGRAPVQVPAEMAAAAEEGPAKDVLLKRLSELTRPEQQSKVTASEFSEHFPPASGPEPTPYHSTEPDMWHSGAEPGSAEAQQAQSLHRYEGEMTAGYRRRLDDERGMSLNELLQALAGVGIGLTGANLIRRGVNQP